MGYFHNSGDLRSTDAIETRFNATIFSQDDGWTGSVGQSKNENTLTGPETEFAQWPRTYDGNSTSRLMLTILPNHFFTANSR
jgi:hypothetical protein